MAAVASTVARALLLWLVAASLSLSSSAQSCTTLTFSRSGDFALCRSLQRLGSTLHWTYHPSNGTVDIAFRAPQSSGGWVAWGINPQGLRMVGTQALVAFVNSSTGRVAPYTSPVTGAPLQPADISIPATNLQGEFSGGVFTIYATLRLNNSQTQVNQVWQSSTTFSAGGWPAAHPTTGENVQSFGRLDFLSGESTSARSPATAPSGGSPAPVPSRGSPAPVPSRGSPAPAPSRGSPAPVPSSGSPAPAPSGGSPVPAPSGGSPTPSNGSPAPSGGNPTPSSGNPTSSGATLLPARLYVCACACLFGWMLM